MNSQLEINATEPAPVGPDAIALGPDNHPVLAFSAAKCNLAKFPVMPGVISRNEPAISCNFIAPNYGKFHQFAWNSAELLGISVRWEISSPKTLNLHDFCGHRFFAAENSETRYLISSAKACNLNHSVDAWRI